MELLGWDKEGLVLSGSSILVGFKFTAFGDETQQDLPADEVGRLEIRHDTPIV